jgi:hypothetical protein
VVACETMLPWSMAGRGTAVAGGARVVVCSGAPPVVDDARRRMRAGCNRDDLDFAGQY